MVTFAACCCCSVLEPVRVMFRFLRDGLGTILSLFTWSNIKTGYKTFKSMTYFQLLVAFLKLNIRLSFLLLTFLFHVAWYVRDYRVISSFPCGAGFVTLI